MHHDAFQAHPFKDPHSAEGAEAWGPFHSHWIAQLATLFYSTMYYKLDFFKTFTPMCFTLLTFHFYAWWVFQCRTSPVRKMKLSSSCRSWKMMKTSLFEMEAFDSFSLPISGPWRKSSPQKVRVLLITIFFTCCSLAHIPYFFFCIPIFTNYVHSWLWQLHWRLENMVSR